MEHKTFTNTKITVRINIATNIIGFETLMATLNVVKYSKFMGADLLIKASKVKYIQNSVFQNG